MQFVAIVDDQYERVTHFPDDDKVTYGYRPTYRPTPMSNQV